MLEGPTNGTTFMFFSCAIDTISAPGSAIAGQPASDIIPISLLFFIGSIYDINNVLSVCSFN